MYQQVYRPVYFQLVDVLLHKAQFPSDEEYSCWSSDEKEQFRIYRYGILLSSFLYCSGAAHATCACMRRRRDNASHLVCHTLERLSSVGGKGEFASH